MIRGVYHGKHDRRENWLIMDLFLKVFAAPGLGFVVTNIKEQRHEASIINKNTAVMLGRRYQVNFIREG